MALTLDLPGLERAGEQLRQGAAGPGWLVVMAVALSMVFRGMRWHVFLRPVKNMPVGEIIRVFGWSFLLLQALPFRTGEGVRVVWGRMHGLAILPVLAGLLVERLTDLLILVALLGLAGLASAGIDSLTGGAAIFLLLGAIGGIVLAPFLLRLLAHSRLRDIMPGLLQRLFAPTAEALTILGTHHTYLRVSGLGMLAWGSLAAGFSAYLHISEPGLPWTAGIAVLAASNLTSLITLAPGNVGLFEATATAVLLAHGLPVEQSLPQAIVLHAFVLLGQLLWGGGCGVASAFCDSRS